MSEETLSHDKFHEHVHAHTGISSCNMAHCHRHLGITSTPINDKGEMQHYHLIRGLTTYDHGHFHTYNAATGLAIPLPQGYHTHFMCFSTSFNDGHDHTVEGFVMPTR